MRRAEGTFMRCSTQTFSRAPPPAPAPASSAVPRAFVVAKKATPWRSFGVDTMRERSTDRAQSTATSTKDLDPPAVVCVATRLSPLAAMLGPERMEEDLRLWKERLDRIWVQEPTDALDMALSDAKKNYPSMDIEPYNDMIDGMLMDTPGHQLFQDRYETWDELYTYCYRVAGTVGLMVLPVLGTSTTHTLEEAIPPGLSLGIAFQITNILRDVGEDALRGRIYLPREDMSKFGVTEEQIIKGVLDDNYKNLMKFEIQRARDYYVEAEAGIPMLAPEARVGVAMALRVYRGILDKLEENDYDNFRKRAYVSKLEKFLYLPDAWKATSGLPP